MRRKYPQPPIIEALCEFQFISERPWDLTIPGLVYERVKDNFPAKRNLQTLNIEVRVGPAALEQKVEPTAPRTQFLSTDEKKVLQVAPDLLVVNRLKPYVSWEEFKPLILAAFHNYDEVANPKSFKRIGLRYINKIEFPTSGIELSDYFSFHPEIPKDIAQSINSFLARVEAPYSEGRDALLLTIANAPPEKPDTASVILDLDYVLARPDGIQKPDLDGWIETAHSGIETAFEACITEKSRKLFLGGQK